MKTDKLSRSVELIYEIGCLRYLKRTWVSFLNPDFENISEHHFRVAWIALIIAKEEKVENTDKVLKMALIHDIIESRVGDANYLQRQYIEEKKDLAFEDMLHSTSLKEELTSLWNEYQKMECIEARIVKDADNLDVDFEIREQGSRGHKFPKEWTEGREYVAKKKLYTKTAKSLWKEIQSTDPHSWHVNGRNRFSSGDWKHKK